MFFKKRRWQITKVSTPEELADKLTNFTWTLCTGFELGGYYFLNDSTSENGAQEYGVIKKDTGKQVESITFSWCSFKEALSYIKKVLAGEYDGQAWGSGIDLNTQLETPEEHGRCIYCA